LFLQPLVENAIIHGFKNIQGQGKITISAIREDENVVFAVEDNGCGIPCEKIKDIFSEESQAIGIANTDKRIKMIYGESYGVRVLSQIGEGTIVMVFIPCAAP